MAPVRASSHTAHGIPLDELSVTDSPNSQDGLGEVIRDWVVESGFAAVLFL